MNNNIKISIADIEVLQKIEKRKSVLNFTEQELNSVSKWAEFFAVDIKEKSPFYRAVNGDWRATEKTKVPIIEIENKSVDFKEVSTDIKSQKIQRGTFKNDDTDWNIQVSRRGLEDTLTYGRRHKDTVTYNMIYQVQKLIQKSVLLDSVIVDKNNDNKGFNSAFMHKFYSFCMINKEPYLVKLSIEEMLDSKQGTIKRLYNLQDIKMESLRHATFTDKQLAFSVLNNSEISVSDLFKAVKEFDKDFYLNKQNSLNNKEVHTIMPEEKIQSEKAQADAKAFLDNFMSEQTDSQSMQIAKAQDTIEKMNTRIERLKSEQSKNNDTVKACNAVIGSNAYPAFSPIISAFKEIIETSSKSKAKKIQKAEKKIKKANKKIKKAEKKLKKVHMLHDFISALKSSDNKQTAFIDGTRAIKDDSLLRLNNKLDKIDVRLKAISTKLQSKNINNADTLKIKAKVQKLKSKKEKIIAKINNLNELEQSLNKLAKIELVKEKTEELANTTVETAEKAVMKSDNISDIIDDIAFASSANIDNVLNQEKVQTKEIAPNSEEKKKHLSEEKNNKPELEISIEHPVKEKVTVAQMRKIVDSGIFVMAGKDKDGKLFAVFDKADTDKVKQIISQEQKRNPVKK